MADKIVLRPGMISFFPGRYVERKRDLYDLVIEQAVKKKKKVAYFHAKATESGVVFELLSHQAKVGRHVFKLGLLSKSIWPKMVTAAQQLVNSRLFIAPPSKAQSILSKIKKSKLPFDLVIADGYFPKDFEKLKIVASQLKIPVVVCHGSKRHE